MLPDPRLTGFALPFLWGLLILLSWIGWGDVLSSIILGPNHSPRDPGIRAGWGMCVTILLGGILNASNLCGIWTVGGLVTIGAIVFLVGFIRTDDCRRAPNIPPGYWPLIALAILIYAASVCWRFNWNHYDDFLAYMVYPIKMLQSGAAHDPFSWRRLSTVGGYSFLESTVAVFGQPQNTFLTDIGLGGILNCLLTVPMLRRAGASPLFSSLAGIICLTLPLGRINSMSYCLGVAGFLLLFRTACCLSDYPPRQRRRVCLIAGGVAAAITTIRPNFLPVAALMLLITELLSIRRANIKISAACLELVYMALGGLVLFAPWSIALHSAAGSYFYPLLKGNQQTVIDIFSRHLGTLGTLKFIVGFFLRPKMLVLIAAGAIALAVSATPATALWIAAVAGAAIVVSRFTTSDFANLTRYTLPSLAAATVAAWISTQFEPAAGFVSRFGKILLIGFACALFILSCVSQSGSVRSAAKSLDLALLRDEPLYPQSDAAQYAAAQAEIPAGATVLTFVDRPFLLNYRRNVIYSIDMPGMASPPPGLPFFQGSAALARYLHNQSIDYLICADFDSDQFMYSRKLYLPGNSRDIIVQRTGARVIDLFQNVDDLAASSPLLFNRDGLRIFRVP